MSATPLATLDLGSLGAQIDAAIMADATIPEGIGVELDAPGPVERGGAEPVETGASPASPPPAAEAAADGPAESDEAAANAAYAARFEADYHERSQRDIAKLRSSLDRRYGDLDRRHREASDLLDETRNYAEFLEAQLAQYDPDEVKRFQRNRQGHLAQRAQERDTKAGQQELRRAFRAQKFPELYPGIDPHDPELLAAFEAGDRKLEEALIRERLARQEAVQARRGVSPAPTAAAQHSPAGGEPPARDAQGRFLPAGQDAGARTREVEKLRGNDGLAQARGGNPAPKNPKTMAEAREFMKAGFARLGVPS